MYETGDTPYDYKVDKIVSVPKKVGTDKCKNTLLLSWRHVRLKF